MSHLLTISAMGAPQQEPPFLAGLARSFSRVASYQVHTLSSRWFMRFFFMHMLANPTARYSQMPTSHSRACRARQFYGYRWYHNVDEHGLQMHAE